MNAFIQPTPTMSSREIAKLTGKKHLHVMRDCQKMFKTLEISSEEYIQNWIDPQNGQVYTEYLLPRLLIETLITGYSLKLRYWVIQHLHELEKTNAFLREQLDSLLQQFNIIDFNLSQAGRILSKYGKQIKPLYQSKINAITQMLQPDLFIDQKDEGEE